MICSMPYECQILIVRPTGTEPATVPKQTPLQMLSWFFRQFHKHFGQLLLVYIQSFQQIYVVNGI